MAAAMSGLMPIGVFESVVLTLMTGGVSQRAPNEMVPDFLMEAGRSFASEAFFALEDVEPELEPPAVEEVAHRRGVR
jgi:hypothetical protein